MEKTNINSKLLEGVKFYLPSFGCKIDQIEEFLNSNLDFEARQDKAIEIIGNIMDGHGKKRLGRSLTSLAIIEDKCRELRPRHRDHVVHALLSFLLGIYIAKKLLSPPLNTSIDDFQWKLAGLFHDIGYPLQIANEGILMPFARSVNAFSKTNSISRESVFFRIVPVGLRRLANRENGFKLIQKRIHEWCLKIDVIKEYERMIRRSKIQHGIISALTILHAVDLMYQEYNPSREHRDIYINDSNWNQDFFEQDIVSACSAIYVHDLPQDSFTHIKIDYSKAPLAFLLKLSDCLQEWDRPSLEQPEGFLASNFDIEILNNKILFTADIPKIKKAAIRNELRSVLANPPVEIR